jgi:hypothetical protein
MDVRAIWFGRQGLPQRLAPDPAKVLTATGWVNTAGGQLPYLSLFARAPLARADVDRAVATGELHEVPSVRGCTMLVPAADLALALFVGRAAHQKAELEPAKKHGGVTSKELDRLCAAVLEALGEPGVALEPKQLHERLGDRIRSLGEAGKKRGMSTTLPLALGRLHAEGHLRRISTTGRLDNARYLYARSEPPRGGPRDEVEAAHALAERFFRWMAPATLKEFAWWAGLGVKAAKAAVEALSLEEDDGGRLRPARDEAEPSEGVALVPFRDNYTTLRRDLSVLFDPADAEREILDWDKGSVALGAAESLHQPAILDRGRLIGLWDYDDRDRTIVARTFTEPARALKRALDSAIAALLPFIREQLGDARYYALDTEKQRHRRVDALRAMR